MKLVMYTYKDGEVFDGIGGIPLRRDTFLGLASIVRSYYTVVTPSMIEKDEVMKEAVQSLVETYYNNYGIPVYVNEHGDVIEAEGEERLNFFKRRKLRELRGYVRGLLSDTDWVCIKLYSLSVEGASMEHIQNERQKYESILTRRKAIREWNDQMEQKIQSATSEEELLGLEISFDSYIGSGNAVIRR